MRSDPAVFDALRSVQRRRGYIAPQDFTALAASTGGDRRRLRAAARAAFRADLFRRVLGEIGADLPGASEKLEGAMDTRTAVASTLGGLLLGPDRFFDGRVFDPTEGD